MRSIRRLAAGQMLLLIAGAVGLPGCGEGSPSGDGGSEGTEQMSGQDDPSSAGGQTDEAGRAANVKRLAANVLFSDPGRYASPRLELFVDIVRAGAGEVTYSWGHSLDGVSGAVSSSLSHPVSQEDLVMAWDAQGRLWAYHPTHLVSYFNYEKGFLSRVRRGGQRDARRDARGLPGDASG